MKTLPAGYAAHLAQSLTTLAVLVKVTRRDSVVLGFTSHDRDIVFGGVTYGAQSALAASEMQSSADLAVDNLRVDGALGLLISAADLEAGLYDGARIEVLRVNWQAPADGAETLRVGELGAVQRRDGAFSAEIRGLTARLAATLTRTYLPACDADLGDARCGVALAGFTLSGAVVTAVAGRAAFTAAGVAEAADWFTFGRVTFTTGANAGRSMEIKRHQAGGVFTLALPMPQDIVPGDTFTAVAGCDKLIGTCIAKFSNAVNFRGFPDLPGQDRLARPGGT
jgi:uncharacterized phage protein (TIGR02218 family)